MPAAFEKLQDEMTLRRRTAEEHPVAGELRGWLALELAQGVSRASAVQVQAHRVDCATELGGQVLGCRPSRAWATIQAAEREG